jgi:hypothetical protein
MGLAVVGMHYTGMAAAVFEDGARCYAGNDLPAAMLSWPTTVSALLILGFGIWFALGDARHLAARRVAAQEMESRVRQMAFTDKDTGLPNRAQLSQIITDRLRQRDTEGFALVTFRLEAHDGALPTSEAMSLLCDRILAALPRAIIARTQTEHLVALIDGRMDHVGARCIPLIESLRHDAALKARFKLIVGSAHSPSDGENAQWLLLRAAPKASSAGLFDNRGIRQTANSVV